MSCSCPKRQDVLALLLPPSNHLFTSRIQIKEVSLRITPALYQEEAATQQSHLPLSHQALLARKDIIINSILICTIIIPFSCYLFCLQALPFQSLKSPSVYNLTVRSLRSWHRALYAYQSLIASWFALLPFPVSLVHSKPASAGKVEQSFGIFVLLRQYPE